MPERVTVGIVDDQSIYREMLTKIVQSSNRFDVVWCAHNGAQALENSRNICPDVVLMDLQMPIMNGIQATKYLQFLPTPPRVIVLTVLTTFDNAITALATGACAYLLKDTQPQQLLDVIDRVMRDEYILSPKIIDLVTGYIISQAKLKNSSSLRATSRLHEREIRVIQELALGKSNKEIAESMFVSAGSVKQYIARACDELGARDRLQLLIRAIEIGLVHPTLNPDKR